MHHARRDLVMQTPFSSMLTTGTFAPVRSPPEIWLHIAQYRHLAWFFRDSPLEERRFEPSVPVAERGQAPRSQIFRRRLGAAG